MSILDDAIREHLELKRAHGADATELKKLEDEAFGPPQRPDELGELAEAPTAFLGDAAEGEPAEEAALGGRRVPNVADLQEAPEPPQPPAEEEQPAMEHEAVPDAAAASPNAEPASHSTEERQAIAAQPTEFFDVEAEATGEVTGPSDEELVDAEMSEPRLAPVDPLAGVDVPAEVPDAPVADPDAPAAESKAAESEIADDPAEEEEEDDFFSEQRLSDELSQALDAPITDEHEVAEQDAEHDDAEHEDDEEYEDEEEPAATPERAQHDPLEGTPDFLEDAPEDDDLWFEQRPPKDFDFDD